MKSTVINILSLFLLLFLFVSCSKKSDTAVTPDAFTPESVKASLQGKWKGIKVVETVNGKSYTFNATKGETFEFTATNAKLYGNTGVTDLFLTDGNVTGGFSTSLDPFDGKYTIEVATEADKAADPDTFKEIAQALGTESFFSLDLDGQGVGFGATDGKTLTLVLLGGVYTFQKI